MSKWQKINMAAFITLIFATISMIFFLGATNYTTPLSKPWHLQESIHEDSLSTVYKQRYQILGSSPLAVQEYDTSRTNVFILIDAWGIPIQEKTLQEDFKSFEQQRHRFALHHRLSNNTSHAENVEIKNLFKNNAFFFKGGDSALAKIDTLLELPNKQIIAWTAIVSQTGDNIKIRQILEKIAKLARKFQNVKFVVQGTHRPILCDSEIKRAYKSHWVPVVILNE